jgi:hypothetical protein
MTNLVRHLRPVAHDEAAPTHGGVRAREPFDLLTLVLFVVGLVPFAGFALRHEWDWRELGLASAMVVFAGRELIGFLARRLGAPGRGGGEGG